MKIALINENSQAAKNALIEATLRKVVEPMGHEVVNYGMYAADDAAQLTYVQNGILAAVLLNSGAADYVITGCGTGEGAMLALNSFPGVICGHVEDPVDAYTFAHVNDGNAVALPFAKGFGWGGELNLEYVFEKLFGFGHGQGYPKERVVPEQRNKKILDGVRSVAFRDLCDIHHARPVFYQVRAENLPYYMDIGLTAIKLGEEARVDLKRFDLEAKGKEMKDLRYTWNRGTRDGLSLEIHEPGTAPMDELKVISDAWLTGKNVREKGFSLGTLQRRLPQALSHRDHSLRRAPGGLRQFARNLQP